MAGANALSLPASGSHTRIQMQALGHAFVPHGTVQAFDVDFGVITAFMDFQAQGEEPYTFTPVDAAGNYVDVNGRKWTLIR